MARPDVQDFVGYWKIVEMEVWTPEFIDLIVPGFIEFSYSDDFLGGMFQFGTVSGELHCDLRNVDGVKCVEWSWEGQYGTNQSSGRGWARLVDGDLVGRIFIHAGDNSAFRAKRRRQPVTFHFRRAPSKPDFH